jgi:hypothetical protein
MNIYCFETLDKRSIVTHFYKFGADDQFHRYIHKRAGTVYENIEDTLSSISSTSKMYLVNVEGRMAAYFVWHRTEKGELVMEGFHVMPEYRNREFLTKFWDIVKEKFEKSFRIGICSKNEVAIKSLFKAGFEPINVVESGNNIFVILKYDQ